MRILWLSDSPTAPTGLGNVTRFVCGGLAALGHEISIIGWQKRGRPLRLRRYTIYPSGDENAEATTLLRHLRKLRPDVLITLADPWRVSHLAQPRLAEFRREAGIVWASYYPVDSDLGAGRLPPSFIHLAQTVDLPIAMSRYGALASRANGLTPAYIPHGVDGKLFSPPADKALAQNALGYGGRFVILSDARNQIRKMLPRLLEIFRRFAGGKDDVLLHLHCDPYDPAARLADYCYDIISDIKLLGLCEKVRFTRGLSIARGTSLAKLAALYRAADVHLLASFGEGFGIPTLQAASAGAVPLAPAYSASRELVQGHGEALRVERFVRDGWGLRRALVDIDDTVERLERLYEDRALLKAKAEAARRFAESYRWERIIPQWHELLQREVPRLRERGRRGTLRASSHFRESDGSRRRAGAAVSARHADRRLPRGLQARIKRLEKRGELLSAEMIRDSQTFQNTFTVPVTPPPIKSAGVERRVTGRVYLAGAADVAVFLKLSRIFPNLTAWTTEKINAHSRRRKNPEMPASLLTVSGRDFHNYLAATTLALDRRGVNPELPALTARAGVPLVSSARNSSQCQEWPDLIVAAGDLRGAAEKCRWMLTDHSAVLRVCALARECAARSRQSNS